MVTTKNAKRATSKADFVRAHPSLSAKELVTKGAAEGIKFAERYVYNVRSEGRTAAKKRTLAAKSKSSKVAARRSTGKAQRGAAGLSPDASKAEDVLRAVAAEIGWGRAVEVIEAERVKVRAVLSR